MVGFAESMGYKMLQRRTESIKVSSPLGQESNFEILDNFAFSSERKRMGIILRCTENDTYIFMLKGADVVIKNLLIPTERAFVEEQTYNLSKEGLRTMVFAQRKLGREEYKAWKEKMKRATMCIGDKGAEELACINSLEQDL